MHFIPQVLFSLLLLATGIVAYRKYSFIRRNILLGRDETLTGSTSERWKNMVLFALGAQVAPQHNPGVVEMISRDSHLFASHEAAAA